MLEAFKSLPEDPDELRAISVQMAQHIQSQAYQIEKLKAELKAQKEAGLAVVRDSVGAGGDGFETVGRNL